MFHANSIVGLAVLVAAMVGATGCASPTDSAQTDDSAEMNASESSVDSKIVGVWFGDDGNQTEVFVLRSNGTYLRAYKASEQPDSALATHREEGTFTAEDGAGKLTATKAPEGKSVPAPKDFSYEMVTSGADAEPELALRREGVGAGVEGATNERKLFRSQPEWCNAENDCNL